MEEDGQFYDSREEISSVSDWGLDFSEGNSSGIEHLDSVLGSFWIEIWT